jgi:hypothetical protein
MFLNMLTWHDRSGVKEAVRSVKTTVKWRAENAHKLAACQRKGYAENHDIFNRFQVEENTFCLETTHCI